MNGDQDEPPAPPQAALRVQHFTTERRVAFTIGLVVGLLLLYLAAIGTFPFYKTGALQALAVLFVAAVNLAYGALLVALWRIVVHPENNEVLKPVGMLVLTALATVAILALDLFGIPRVGGDAVVALLVAAGLGVAAGLALALLGGRRFRENRDDGKPLSGAERAGLSVVAVDAGLTLGLVVMALPIGISAYFGHVRIAHF